MLYDAKGFDHIYIAPGYTDMRKGIDGLITKIGYGMGLNPFQEKVLFLFCGRAANKIKGMVWEKDGFLLLYKRVDKGSYVWPRTATEAMSLTQEQFERLMSGFAIESRIRESHPKTIL